MPTNLLKKYNEFLELLHLTEHLRKISLLSIFNRDIADNQNFLFRTKIIRPIKKEGVADVETLFDHLTKKSEDVFDEYGKKLKARNSFDIERSKRLHWIWYHVQELKSDRFEVFSAKERKNGTDVIHTYLFDLAEDYVIVLEPQRSKQDYYLLSAYYLNEDWAKKNMRKKLKRKLDEVH